MGFYDFYGRRWLDATIHRYDMLDERHQLPVELASEMHTMQLIISNAFKPLPPLSPQFLLYRCFFGVTLSNQNMANCGRSSPRSILTLDDPLTPPLPPSPQAIPQTAQSRRDPQTLPRCVPPTSQFARCGKHGPQTS